MKQSSWIGLALVAMTGAALSLVLALPRSIAAAQPCAPTAIVAGDSSDAEAIASALGTRGIGSTERAGCPLVRAIVERREGRVAVSVEDAAGRRSERVVPDVQSAADIVESWTRVDLTAPLLAARETSAPEPVTAPELAREMVDEERPPRLEPVGPQDELPRPLPVGVSVAGEASLGDDAALWLGVSGAACVRIGPVCAGVLTRLAIDTRATGEVVESNMDRLAVDMLLSLELAGRVGPVTITPGIGVGAGWVHRGNLPPGGNPGRAGHDEGDLDGGGLRGDAHIRLSIPLTDWLALDLAIAADASLFAHAETLTPDGMTIVGEPVGFLRTSVGLRWGMP